MASRRRKRLIRQCEERDARIMATAREAKPLPPPDLCSLCKSRSGNQRAFAFIQMSDLLVSTEAPLENREFLEPSAVALSDPDLLARRFAMHVLSSFSEDLPEEVWPYVSTQMRRIGKESREYLGVTVLEELLHTHFDTIFPKLQREVAAGNRGLLDALSFSWFNDRGDLFWKAQEYLASEGHRHASRTLAT